MPASYAMGNSWQLNWLSRADRERLDQEPWVFCCSRYPQHWRIIGVRPTVAVVGDSVTPDDLALMEDQFQAILRDDVLRQRLRLVFACAESPEAEQLIAAYIDRVPGLCRYVRPRMARLDAMAVATRLDQPIWHYCTTYSDMLNIAWLLNTGREIRMIGNQFGTAPGHFEQGVPAFPTQTTEFIHGASRLWWDGFVELFERGVDLVDCNFMHTEPVPAFMKIPRTGLFAARERSHVKSSHTAIRQN